MRWEVTKSCVPLPQFIESAGTRQLTYLMQSVADEYDRTRNRAFGRLTFQFEVDGMHATYRGRTFARLRHSPVSHSLWYGHA